MMDRVLIWNARGVGNSATVRHVRNFIKKHSLQMVVLNEPFINASRQDQIGKKFKLKNFLSSKDAYGKIWGR